MSSSRSVVDRPSVPLVGEDWPLVGRSAELARMAALLRGAAPAVVLAGPAGVGKTRLATECLTLAGKRGFACARVIATQAAASLPFGAYAPLLSDLGPGGGGGDLRHAARAVAARGGGKRVALLVDDAHLLDDASAALTHQLAADHAAFVVATVRSTEPASDAVVALWKEGVAERLEIPPLGRPEVEALLAAALGSPLEGATAHHLYDRSGGNVLFLKELVRAGLEAGVLRQERNLWCLRGPLPASPRLVELIEARLAGLDRADRETLEVLALGEPLGVDLAPAFGGEPRIEALERRHLVRVEQDGRRLAARVAHPLYGDVLRARLSPLRARALSRALADRVEATGARRPEDALRVATWRVSGGGAVDRDLMVRAATTALHRHDFPLAERLARAALEAGAGCHAAVVAAQAVGLQGRAVEAESELSTLAARASTDGERGMVAATRMANLHDGLGRSEDALRVAEEVEAAIDDRQWRDEIFARRASVLGRTRGPRVAVQAAEVLRREVEGPAYVVASCAAAQGLARMGCLTAALDAAARAHDARVAMREPVLRWTPEVMWAVACEALMSGGRLADAEGLAAATYRQALADRSTEAQALAGWQLARVFLIRGDAAAAARYGHEAAALLRNLHRMPLLGGTLASLATALALMGRVDEANASLAELESIDLPPENDWAVDVLQGRAWTAVAAGDLLRARPLLEQGAALGERTGDRAGQSAALHDLARLGRARDVAGRLAVLATEMEGELPAARAMHGQALATGNCVALEEASARFEMLGAGLLAAEAAADAAVAWRRAGDPRRATASERRALHLGARCQGARTPALTAVGARAVLTGREIEIARLAAAGVPNKEIARRLYLSLHTVQNKLHSAYEKLGVTGRAELADALEGW